MGFVGEMVEFPSNGGTGSGYLATPADGRKGPGVVVIQEWWGLVDHIKRVTDRFAEEGFVALAPDLYEGRVAKEPDEAGKAMMELEMDRAARDLGGAVDHLLAHPQVEPKKVAAVGFCMGGTLAMTLATVRPIDAVVDYYGGPLKGQLEAHKIKAAVLGHFGTKDEWATPVRARELLNRLHRLGIEAEFYTYPGADHAFFNDDRPEVYDPRAAALSWERSIAFLRDRLGAA